MSKNTKKSSIVKVKEKAPEDHDLKAKLKKFLKYQKHFYYPVGFDGWKFYKSFIYELTEDGHFFRCSCGHGMKKYFREHNIAFSIKFKDFIITDVAKSVPLNQKKEKRKAIKKQRLVV